MLTVLLVSKNVQCTRNFDRVSKKPKKNILAINLAHFDDYLANTLFNHSLNSLNISFEKSENEIKSMFVYKFFDSEARDEILMF